jgi:NTP pyrophosphatase (non-canonical NTP hydrolase)
MCIEDSMKKVSKMTGKEFIENALITESKDFNKIRERFLENSLSGILVEALDEFVVAAIKLDTLKKHIFYGTDVVFDEWEAAAGITSPLQPEDRTIRLLHVALGLITESAEFAMPVVDALVLGSETDDINLVEEIGDLHWYEAICYDVLGGSFEANMERIIKKLRARYGNKFAEANAKVRDLEVERKILEDN